MFKAQLPMRQASFFPEAAAPRYAEKTSGSFVGNMDAPVHRWFRYSAGFSGAWAEDLIAREAKKREVRVLDPFAGSATTLIAAEQCGVESWGIDSHPFVARVARAKLAYRSSPSDYLAAARQVLAQARKITPELEIYAPLMRRCYTDEALRQLDCLRRAIETADEDSESGRLVWLTLVAILRATSHVGTANWQYLLPDRRKARVEAPFAAFEAMMHVIHGDMRAAGGVIGPRAGFSLTDARTCNGVPEGQFNPWRAGGAAPGALPASSCAPCVPRCPCRARRRRPCRAAPRARRTPPGSRSAGARWSSCHPCR